MKGRTAAVVGAVILVALLAMSSASAWAGRPSSRTELRAARQALRAVSSPATHAFAERAARGQAFAPPASTTFAGFLYCQDPWITQFPAWDPTHAATVTAEYLFSDTDPSFGSPTSSGTPPWLQVVFSNSVAYRTSTSNGQVLMGPVPYVNVGTRWTGTFAEPYETGVNVIWYLDGNVLAGPYVASIFVTGPNGANLYSANICHMTPAP